MLRFGPDTGPVVVVALPLFEEANRTRAFAVSILRALAARGIALPADRVDEVGFSVAKGRAALASLLKTSRMLDDILNRVPLRSGDGAPP